MSREELLKTIRLCKTDGNAECEECSLHGAKGDCVATLLQECEEEIVFLDGLLAAERMLEDALRKQVALRNERLDKMCAEIDHLREATKMMPKWVSVTERLPHFNQQYLVTACDENVPAGEGIWYSTVVVVAEYYDGCWTWDDSGTEYDLNGLVTHWMPLPEPPSAEEVK